MIPGGGRRADTTRLHDQRKERERERERKLGEKKCSVQSFDHDSIDSARLYAEVSEGG